MTLAARTPRVPWATSPPGLERYLRNAAALLRRRAAAAAGFAVLMTLFEMTRGWAFGGGLIPGREQFMNVAVIVAAVAAPCLVDAAEWRPAWRAVGVIVVTLALVTLVAVLASIGYEGYLSVSVANGSVYSNEAYLLRKIWTQFAGGVLFAAYCSERERELDAVRAARTAELARVDAERDVAELRLRVLQSRVEPALLFGALEEARRLYPREPAAAEALLDELIAYLRAALPQLRRQTSTVLREAHVVEGYLRLLLAAYRQPPNVRLLIGADVAAVPFPPALLLQSIQAVGAPVAAEGQPRPREVCVRARRVACSGGPRFRLAVALDRSLRHDDGRPARLDAVRAHLARCLGADATLRVHDGAGGTGLFIAWSGAAAAAGPVVDQPR